MFPDVPPAQREQYLTDNAEAVEAGSYFRRATEDELAQQREVLTDASISAAQVENEKKEALADFKERLKPLKQEQARSLEFLRLKGEEVSGKLYKFIDHEAGEVGYYNAEGELISQRRAYPDEQQTSIRSINAQNQ